MWQRRVGYMCLILVGMLTAYLLLGEWGHASATGLWLVATVAVLIFLDVRAEQRKAR